MSKRQPYQPGDETSIKNIFSRRDFVRSGALVAAALAASKDGFAAAAGGPAADEGSAIRLGVASYTFRNFSRAQMIGFLKQDYTAAGIKLHAAGTIYFPKDEDADIRSKFEYCKRAGIGVIVAGDPAPETLPRIEKFVKEYDLRFAIHNHGPEDKLWHSPLDVLKAVKGMDARIGCCVDVGHTVRAGTDVVQAIRDVGARVFNVHMKDLANFDKKDSQVAVGEGITPVKKIFEALGAIKYKGFVDLEYEIHADDPMPGVIGSFAYMRGVLAGMG